MDRHIETSHARCSPRRFAKATHSGMENAAAMKYSTRNSPAYCGKPRRSLAKNRKSVAGIAAAMPFSMKTANSQRKCELRNGANEPCDGVGRGCAYSGRGA